MANGLVIAEKKSVSDDLEKAYKLIKGGYPHSLDFGAAAGHLLQLSEPDSYRDDWGKPWRKEVLPMIPDKWHTEVVRADYYKKIKDAVKSGKYDFLVNACDCGREGEHIFYTIYEKIEEETGISLPVKRMWFDDQTVAEVQRSLKDLKDENDFAGYRISSTMRARLDWLMGVNFSRMASLTAKSFVIVGRCISVLLAMVSKRELEIRAFTPVPYFEYKATFKTSGGDAYTGLLVNPANEDDKHRFHNKADLEALSFGGTYTVKEVAIKDKKLAPKQLMNLSELQKECSRSLGLTASKTLDIAQSLYEKKLISYPRTEYRYLTDGVTTKFISILTAIKSKPEYEPFASAILKNPQMRNDVASNPKYVDNKKVGDHHAIIPTETKPDISLTDLEKKVYDVVVRRFLSIFYPPCIMANTTITTAGDNGHVFISTGSVMREAGWKEICGNDTKDEILPDVKKNDNVSFEGGEIQEKETKAPPRYNDASIITCMETAGRDVDDEELKKILEKTAGIGTPATRAGIIESCVNYKWIERVKKGKNSVFVPTDFGLKLYDLLKDQDFMSPALTAEWEKKLLKIEKNNGDDGDIYADITDYIKEGCEKLASGLKAVEGGFLSPTVGKCPDCGRNIIIGKNSYFCKGFIEKLSDGSPSCSFGFPNVIAGAKISETQAKKLLNEKATDQLKFKSKNNTDYTNSLMLQYNEEKKKHEVVFAPFTEQSVGNCPLCGGRVIKGGKVYFCEKCRNVDDNGNRGCSFTFWASVGGADITPADAEKLLADGVTARELTFESKKYGKYKRKLVLKKDENGKYVVSLMEKQRIEAGKCPKCGRTMFESDKSYYCTGTMERDEKVCSFIVPKSFGGISITPADLEEFSKTGVIKDKKTRDGDFVRFEAGRDYYGNDTILCVAGKCPKCGNRITVRNNGYFCDTDNCVKIFNPMKGMGVELSIKDVRTLLLGQQLKSVDCTTKRGKGKVTLKLDDNGKVGVVEWK